MKRTKQIDILDLVHDAVKYLNKKKIPVISVKPIPPAWTPIQKHTFLFCHHRQSPDNLAILAG